jgi:hypothetical protein
MKQVIIDYSVTAGLAPLPQERVIGRYAIRSDHYVGLANPGTFNNQQRTINNENQGEQP